MKTIYSELHHLQRGRAELNDGQLMPCFEKPERADLVLGEVQLRGLGEVLAPQAFDRQPLARVHKDNYLDFLETAWDGWVAEHGDAHDALPLIWPVRGFRQLEPAHIDGKLGYFSCDAGTPITRGTWQAARTAANVALTGQSLVAGGQRGAFALCRPPGHHAAADYCGGYCFLNNAAIAAQAFRDGGAARVAVLDVDYHHGNGTQSIFYERGDVLTVSLHSDPVHEFPYFLGFAEERGSGEGEGTNRNFPLAFGTDAQRYLAALEEACREIQSFGPEALVVSLGVDTFEGDPISRFKLASTDFFRIGEQISRLDLPTLFVLEGGYAVEAIGVNAVNVLEGFEGRN